MRLRRIRCRWLLVLTLAVAGGCTASPAPTGPSVLPLGAAPLSGTRTCHFGADEIGEGELTVDLAANTVSGWVEPFWLRVRYQLVPISFAPGAMAFALEFGTHGVLEVRLLNLSPRALHLVAWSRGGGEGFAAVNGVMSGVCQG